MEPLEALRIVGALADGRDPISGQVLPADHVCQQPQVVRALCLAVQRMQQGLTPAPSHETHLRNAGKPWTATEDAQLVRAFDAGANLKDLARQHGRTRQAIHGRLYRLGKMPPWPFGMEKEPKAGREPGKPWTPEEDAELLRGHDAGLTIDQLAQRLGRGQNAVDVRLCSLGRGIDEAPNRNRGQIPF